MRSRMEVLGSFIYNTKDDINGENDIEEKEDEENKLKDNGKVIKGAVGGLPQEDVIEGTGGEVAEGTVGDDVENGKDVTEEKEKLDSDEEFRDGNYVLTCSAPIGHVSATFEALKLAKPKRRKKKTSITDEEEIRQDVQDINDNNTNINGNLPEGAEGGAESIPSEDVLESTESDHIAKADVLEGIGGEILEAKGGENGEKVEKSDEEKPEWDENYRDGQYVRTCSAPAGHLSATLEALKLAKPKRRKCRSLPAHIEVSLINKE